MKILWLLLFCSITAQAQNPTAFEIHYVGNMGVAIVKNDSVILIDALHDYYDVYYLPTDTAILSKIKNRVKPFKTLVAIVATHMHKDHFDETIISNLSSKLLSTKTIVGEQPAQTLTNMSSQQLKVIRQTGTLKLNEFISITMKNIGHVGQRHLDIENYRVEIAWGKQRFVHFGDAAASEKSFDGLLPGAEVAIVPDWLCYDASDIALLEKQQFRKIVATHIAPSGMRNEMGKSSIEIIPFVKYGQVYRQN